MTRAALSEAAYREIKAFLTSRTGLSFSGDKEDDLRRLLEERMDAPGGRAESGRYLETLREEGTYGYEMRWLVSHLTVGETYFFRNRPQFTVLKDHILPAVISRNRHKSRSLRIWSAGCSTGEEPYSLAMLLLELLPDLAEWRLHILGTDINEEALEIAREGRYREWSFRETEGRYRDRYFVRDGRDWRLRREVSSLVTFAYLNLADDVYPTAVTGTNRLDLIVCRNVLIYFKPDLGRIITHRFFRALSPDGCLLAGHSESSDLVAPGFQRRFVEETFVYVRPGAAGLWETAIRPRYRGSGPPPKDTVFHHPPAPAVHRTKRPAETPETVLFEEAVSYVRAMRIDDAIARFQRVIEVNPRNERALYSIALLHANRGEEEVAQRYARRLVDGNPLHLEATYLLAIIARSSGERGRELDYLRRTVYINPEFVLGHFQMGICFRGRGDETAARRSFDTVLRLLDGRDDDALIDGVDGLTAGRLRETTAGLRDGGGEEGR